MNATLILILSSLLMGTSFLSEVPEDSSKNKGGEATHSFLSSHPLITGAAVVRGPGCAGDQRRGGQYIQEEDDYEDDPEDDRRGRPSRRHKNEPGFGPDEDGCLVRFGLHYSSCFSKSKDFDDKLGQLQNQGQSWPRGGGAISNPCSTLQLLAKVKSSPLFERCHSNQFVVRTPYHMYNVKGELRYIVQDAPRLEQCYLEAQCSIPGDLCRGYGHPGRGYGGRRSMASPRCEPKQCHHTLLSWDPDNPDAGTFFDVFEYSCCCSCQSPMNVRQQQLLG